MSEPQCIVISNRPPRYSEAWMTRMTLMLPAGSQCIYFYGRARGPEKCTSVLISDFRSRIPDRFASLIMQRSVLSRMMSCLESICDPMAEAGPRLLIHYLTNAVLLAPILEKISLPVYVHCHGHDITWDRKVEGFKFLRAHSRGYLRSALALRERVTLIANSEATRKKLLDAGFSDLRIVVKHLGAEVPNKPFPLANDGSPLNVLYLGRLVDCKGPRETILAFDRACQHGFRGELTLAGGGALLKKCQKLASASCYRDRIKLLGAVPPVEAQRLLRSCDILTAHNQISRETGQEEAYGVSVVEAMAYGRPVLTGRSGGVCETVVSGETGILFEPGDITQHSESLLLLDHNRALLRAYGDAAYVRAKSYFSLSAEQTKLHSLLLLHHKTAGLE